MLQKVVDVWKLEGGPEEANRKNLKKVDAKLSNFVLCFWWGNGFLFFGDRFETNETYGFKNVVCALEKKD